MRTILAAAGVIIDDQGRLLLILRAKEPEAGRWTVPGGRVEPGESLREAAVREVREETGIDVVINREVWSLTVPARPGATYEIHDFLGAPVGGVLVAGDDAADARWFTASEMTTVPLTHDLLGYLQRAGLHGLLASGDT